ncbi:hypothetical protein GLS40_14705 [Pseudooceanicola sp. 216_PA32_1]|uniref:Uncharacterized protein n=1 Tax=Pseudooceanicola pacificus TaxID=2676438 RepID=A0A844WDM1_9RHOB|nr:hypothetical protein [Pseudooceanicola pacificus]MWB79288.1 hypothetical protein [Pseudooceanicola pacificus]
MTRSRHPIAELLLLSLFIVAHASSVWFAFTDPDYFTLSYAAEDGPLEYATAVLLFIGCLVLARRALQAPAHGQPRYYLWLTGLYALMFFFAAGEEVSWGQRIFDWQSSAYFLQHNYQGETNLHNLVIGDVHLAEKIFGNALTPIILLYLLVLPLLFGRVRWVGAFVRLLAVPVPRGLHAWMALIASLLMGVITIKRQFELYELAFGIITLMIFLSPRNPGVWGLTGPATRPKDETLDQAATVARDTSA